MLFLKNPKKKTALGCREADGFRSYRIAEIAEILKSGYFTVASTAVVLSEHLPRPGIRSPDLSALKPKVLTIRPPHCYRDSGLLFLAGTSRHKNKKPFQLHSHKSNSMFASIKLPSIIREEYIFRICLMNLGTLFLFPFYCKPRLQAVYS